MTANVSKIEKIEDLWLAGTHYDLDTIKKAKADNLLLHLDMDFTGKCDLKCSYCDRTPDRYNKNKRRIQLSTEERINLIDQAKLLGAKTVEFPGAGEPLLDEGFWDVIEHIHANDMTPVVFTSGYELTEEVCDRLKENNVSVFLKYNHTDVKIQDKMVQVEGYGEKATNALQYLIERGFNDSIPTKLAIDMVVTQQHHDIDDVKGIFRWCRTNNIHMYISTLIPEGLADSKAKVLEKDRAKNLQAELRKVDEEEFGFKYTPVLPLAGGYRCRQVNVGMHINLFGEVYDCNGLGRFLGYIRSNSLEEIWNAAFSQNVRAPLQDGFCLLRERVWGGVQEKGFMRKMQEYDCWKEQNGPDPILEQGLIDSTAGKKRADIRLKQDA